MSNWEYIEFFYQKGDYQLSKVQTISLNIDRAEPFIEELTTTLRTMGYEPDIEPVVGIMSKTENKSMIKIDNVSRVNILNALSANGWEPLSNEASSPVLFRRPGAWYNPPSTD